ncbi:MAG: hypothetical protein ABSF33_07235 [Acidimicrobiales bacterium]
MTTDRQSRAWIHPPPGFDHRARSQRDAALQRVNSITKAIAVASVTAAVAIGIYVSRAVPGHSTIPAGAASGTTGTTGAASGTGSGVPAAGTSQPSSLSPPNTPPTPTQQQAPVVSGAT